MKKVFLAFMVMAFRAQAFEVDQTIIQMTPQGLDSKKVITLENKEKYKKYVSVEVTQRVFGKKDDETKPTELLKTSEKNLTLEPNSQVKLSLEWTGKPEQKDEVAFRVTLTEMKNDNPKADTLKQPLVRYVTSVFVTPEQAKDQVVVQKSELKNPNHLVLTLKNTGKRHKLFNQSSVVIHDTATKEVLTKIDHAENLEQTLVMPGQTKVVEIPLDKEIKNKQIKVSITE